MRMKNIPNVAPIANLKFPVNDFILNINLCFSVVQVQVFADRYSIVWFDNE